MTDGSGPFVLETCAWHHVKVFVRFSQGFRKVFVRFSRGFRFKNIFVKGSREQKKSIFACRGGPRPRRRRPGPPRHAKIGKNGTVRYGLDGPLGKGTRKTNY